MNVRALSVREPWASLIATGRKSIEVRTWTTKHRGPLLICSAGRSWKGDYSLVLAPGEEVDVALSADRGVAVALVELVDVRPATARDATSACILPPEGAFAWVLANPRRVAATPVRGLLGLFTLDIEL